MKWYVRHPSVAKNSKRRLWNGHPSPRQAGKGCHSSLPRDQTQRLSCLLRILPRPLKPQQNLQACPSVPWDPTASCLRAGCIRAAPHCARSLCICLSLGEEENREGGQQDGHVARGLDRTEREASKMATGHVAGTGGGKRRAPWVPLEHGALPSKPICSHLTALKSCNHTS